jgi:hypothetical protein
VHRSELADCTWLWYWQIRWNILYLPWLNIPSPWLLAKSFDVAKVLGLEQSNGVQLCATDWRGDVLFRHHCKCLKI